MNSTTKLDKKLTVNQRLATLGITAFLGFGSMLAIGWYQNSHVDSALEKAIEAQAAIKNASELRLANLELVLVAMDTIIDREERAIQPERLKTIEESLKRISDGKAGLASLAGELGTPEIMATFDADLTALTKAIQVDLKKMVEEGAPAEAYGALDDAIDGGGERLNETMTTLTQEAGELLAARVNEATTTSSKSILFQFIAGLIAMSSLLAMIYFHGNVLRRGIFAVRDNMKSILAGNYATAVESVNRSDEIGEMARSVDMFRRAAVEKQALETETTTNRRQNEAERQANESARSEETQQIKAAVAELGRGLNRLAEGNLMATIEVPFRADLEPLRLDFNQTVERLQNVLGNVQDNTVSIQSNSQQMRGAADDLAKRTEQQAASLEQTSAALDEITATVRTATQRAEEASKMVGETRNNAEESGRIVGEAISAMSRIEDASTEIGKIINVIDEIAFQTNLLALNAGVEAARAGDAGKGFAVVAQEVRELAQRAAGAAKDIKALVSRSSSEVGTGVQLVRATGEALGMIEKSVVQINEHMTSIVNAAREQSTGLQEINTAVGRLDQMTQQNAAMVEETNAVSHTLAHDAESLTALVGQFQLRGGQVQQPRPQPVRVASSSAAVRPIPSPAKALMGKLSGAFNSSHAAPVAKASGSTENWEEF